MKQRLPFKVEPLEVRRLLSAGDLNPTFGVAGAAVYSQFPGAIAVALQKDGKIVVADPTGLERFSADGSLDPSLGTGGRVDGDFGITGMALTGDGKIVVAGDALVGGRPDPDLWRAARFNADGSPDVTFGGTENFPPGEFGFYSPAGTRDGEPAFALAPDGKIILAGPFTSPGALGGLYANHNANLDVFRLDADGSFDTAFARGGELIDGPTAWDGVFSVAVKPDGSFDVFGATQFGFGSTGESLAVSADGQDFSHAMDPSMSTETSVVRADGTVVAAGNDGSTLGGGIIDVGSHHLHFAFNTTLGAAPPRYSLTKTSGVELTVGRVGPLAVAPGNQLYVGSWSGNSVAVARLNPDYTPDDTFGFGGTTTFTLDPYHDGWTGVQSVTALALTANGDLLVAGDFRDHLFLARIQGGTHALTTRAPTAILNGHSDFYHYPNGSHEFASVRYSGPSAIDASTLDNADLLVTGPNSYSEHALLANPASNTVYTSADSATPLDVGYSIPAPAGGWTAANDGLYTISVESGQVRDVTGQPVPAGPIGTFTPNEDGSPPPSMQGGATLLSPYGPVAGEKAMTFSVKYRSPSGMDLSTLGDGNFQVATYDIDHYLRNYVDAIPTPGLVASAMLIGYHRVPHGSAIVATYRVSAPGGAWNSSDNYGYVIQNGNRPVLDRAGGVLVRNYPYLRDQFGAFRVDLPHPSPTARLLGVQPPGRSRPSPRFRVLLTSEAGIDVGTIQKFGLSLSSATTAASSGPNYTPVTRIVNLTSLGRGRLLVTFAAPAGLPPGTYDLLAGPVYRVTQLAPQEAIQDVDGRFVPPGLLGSFTVPRYPPTPARRSDAGVVAA